MNHSVSLAIKVLARFAFLVLLLTTFFIKSNSQGPLRDWLAAELIPFEAGIPGATGISLAYSKGYLYAIGGATGSGTNPFQTLHKTVFRGNINPTGEVMSWSTQTEFGSPLNITSISFAGTATSSTGRIYITGGRTLNGNTGATYYALPDDNGNIDEWTKATIQDFSPRHLASAVILKDKLYVIGGLGQFNGSLDVKDEVVFTRIEPMDPAWQPATQPLLPGRYGSSAVVLNDRIYVIGGIRLDQYNNAFPLNEVIFTKPTSTGDILKWDTTTAPLTPNLNEGLALMAAVAVTQTNKIYILGGRQAPGSGPAVARVFSGSPNSTGDIIQWVQEDVKDLPEPLLRHAAVFAPNGSIYVVGGQNTTSGGHRKTVYYLPTIDMEKSSAIDKEPLSEGSNITYYIDYENTSLITHSVTITDIIPWNLIYVSGSATPEAVFDGHQLRWFNIQVPPGGTGQVSFKARVALLPSLHDGHLGISSLSTSSPAYVLPAAVACDTTRFWANGVTRQPPIPNPHTIQVQIPPGSNPSAMWLLMKGTDNDAPTVAGSPVQLLKTNDHLFGASVWTAPITPAMVEAGQVTVVTHHPRELNALFLFDANDPPFDEEALDILYNETKLLTYTLEMPSVTTRTMDVLLPFVDITYLTDDLLPDDRMTTVTVEYGGQPAQTITVNDPNLGNGLLMAQFPIDIGHLSSPVASKILTITVDTEDSIYTLGPRICRPVYIENTALLCSLQAGCISSTVTNIPVGFDPYGGGGIYLPIIMKSSS